MQTLKLEVEVSKEAYELAQGLYQIVLATKEALADGWNPLTDIPSIMIDAVKVLPSALGGLDLIDDEYLENPEAVLKAFSLSSAQLASMILAKKS